MTILLSTYKKNGDIDVHKVALVIGGSSGIGLSVVRTLLDNDFIVYNISRRKCIDERAVSIIADVTNDKAIKNAIDEVIYKRGRIDVFIYSAGFSMAYPLDKVKEADYRYLFEVNFFGFIKTLQSVIHYMKEQGRGKIVVISSIGGVLPIPYDGYYSASKAAINMLCKSLSLELKKSNIDITSVMPGGTRNHFTFKRKIDNSDLKDHDLYQSIITLAKIEQNGSYNEQVAKCVYRVIKSKNPPVLIVSGIKNKYYYLLSKVLPTNSLLYFTKKQFRLS
jgi:short-subunit dehydrogenase